jgi:glycosyltransferase involved in cell wall biosynthesis
MHSSGQETSLKIPLHFSGKIKGTLPDGAKRLGSKLFSVEPDPNLKKIFPFDSISPYANEGMCVVGIAADDGACGHYRLKFPLMHLAKSGAEIRIVLMSHLGELNMGLFKDATHVILSRCGDREMFQAIRSYCTRNDITLVYDLDDCLHEIAPQNPAYGLFDPEIEFGRKNMKDIEDNLKESDGVIFSTRELKGYYHETLPDSHILHNGLDLSLGMRRWDCPERQAWREVAIAQDCHATEDSVVLGWAGSITHIADLEPMGDAIRQILHQNPHAILAMYCDVELAMHCCLTLWHLPSERFFLVPPTSFMYYPEKLGYFDIGLAPLENSAFNRCKSDLRLMEMGALGVPYVASKVAPYYRFHLQSRGVGGFLATNTEEWVQAVSQLIRKPEERQLRGASLRQYVFNHCDISNTASTLIYTLRTIRENSRSYTKAPDATMLEDNSRGIPYPKKTYDGLDFCPCGSGDPYGRCWHNCAPAWGAV